MIFGVTHEMLADKMFPGRYRLVLVVNALTFGTRPATDSKGSHYKPLASLQSHQH